MAFQFDVPAATIFDKIHGVENGGVISAEEPANLF